MRIKSPRWLLLLEAVLLLGAILVLAYKAATRVLPLPLDKVEQARQYKRPDPQTQLLEYYRQYPDRYIRAVDESWVYNNKTRVAIHSFTLRNLATVAYTGLEVSFSYESAGGKTLTRTVKIPGFILASASRSLKNIAVKEVPAGIKSVTTIVSKAQIAR